jgi:crossover junction endodeoxyribonuclease RusA
MSHSPTLEFVVPGPAQPKGRPRLGANGNVYTPRRTSRYEMAVRVHAMAAMARQRWTKTLAPCAVTARVYWPNARRRDLDNVIKVALDAMNKTVWNDDSQVVELHVYGAVDVKEPRLEIMVEVRQP